MAKSLLDQLSEMTVVVCDTGDIQSIRRFTPRDATTNPSLITAASYDSTDFGGAPSVNVNNSAVSSPNEADVLENVDLSTTSGVELGNGNGAASDEVFMPAA